MALTVRDMAEKLVPLSPEGDVESIVRQLRHWSLTGVLQPSGALHVGAGRYRKYDKLELYFAALALELSRWRIPVGVSDRLVQAVRNEHRLKTAIDAENGPSTNTVQNAIDGARDIYL